MRNAYIFETINNQNHVKYQGRYLPNGSFVFNKGSYFTMIKTSSTSDGYSNAFTYPANGYSITKYGIDSMLTVGVRVDLIVDKNIVLSLTNIDDSYAYFSNGDLSLKVDSNGAVTEASINPSE